MNSVLYRLDLQFFADDTNEEQEQVDEEVPTEDTEVSVEAFADIISEKDKRIEELEAEVTKQKRTIAEMTVRISAGQKTEKTFEENLLGLVGQPARKE